MKKMIVFSTISFLSLGLVACNNNANEVEVSDNTANQQEEDEHVDGEETEREEESLLVDRNESEDNGSEPNLGEGDTDTEDQLDLKIGDTGTIETTIEMFEMTINSVEIDTEIDEEKPDLGIFVLADVTFKNLHDEPLDLQQAVDTFEITSSKDGGGYGSVSEHYNVEVEGFEGQLESDETVSGQILFEDNPSEIHYIKVNPGLVGSSAVKNQVIWLFAEEVYKN